MVLPEWVILEVGMEWHGSNRSVACVLAKDGVAWIKSVSCLCSREGWSGMDQTNQLLVFSRRMEWHGSNRSVACVLAKDGVAWIKPVSCLCSREGWSGMDQINQLL